MRGTNRTATIYIRSGGGWVAAGTTWTCRVQPLSPTLKIQSEKFMYSTHMAIGKTTPVITEGMRLDIGSDIYYVAGVQMHNRPGVGNHHQEVWLSMEA